MYWEAFPGSEKIEGRADDGRDIATAENRGLYNLRIPAPTTPEGKETRQWKSRVRISLNSV